MTRRYTKTITVNIPRVLRESIDEWASHDGMSRAGWCREILIFATHYAELDPIPGRPLLDRKITISIQPVMEQRLSAEAHAAGLARDEFIRRSLWGAL